MEIRNKSNSAPFFSWVFLGIPKKNYAAKTCPMALSS